MFSLLNKVWSNAYDQIVVNEDEIFNIKKLITDKKDDVFLIPANKSYVDFMLIGYLHFYF